MTDPRTAGFQRHRRNADELITDVNRGIFEKATKKARHDLVRATCESLINAADNALAVIEECDALRARLDASVGATEAAVSSYIKATATLEALAADGGDREALAAAVKKNAANLLERLGTLATNAAVVAGQPAPTPPATLTEALAHVPMIARSPKLAASTAPAPAAGADPANEG